MLACSHFDSLAELKSNSSELVTIWKENSNESNAPYSVGAENGNVCLIVYSASYK